MAKTTGSLFHSLPGASIALVLWACGGSVGSEPAQTGGAGGSGAASTGNAGAGNTGAGNAGAGNTGAGAGTAAGGGPSFGGAAGAPATWGEAGCAICLKGSCPDAITECQAVPDCAAYLACVTACPLQPGVNLPQEACAQVCGQPGSEAGKKAVGKFTACYEATQSTPTHPCTRACSQTGVLFGESACWSCVSAQCASLVTACESSADCKATLQCVRSCGQSASNPGGPNKECGEGCPAPTSPQGSAALEGASKCGEEIEKPGAACGAVCAPKP